MNQLPIFSKEFLINSLCLAFLAGVSLMSWRVGFALFGVLMPLAWGMWVWHYRRLFKRELLVLVGVAMLLGGLRIYGDIAEWRAGSVGRAVGTIGGVVIGFPDVRADEQKILVAAQSSDGERLIELKIPPFQKILPDDNVTFQSELIAATDRSWPEGLRGSFFRKGVEAVAKKVQGLRVLMSVKGDLWQETLRGIFVVRVGISQILNRALAEPAASLIAGILIGDRGNLSAEVVGDFQKTGMTHILAISGFNITIIINLILLTLAGSGKGWRLIGCLVLIGVFIFLTGASASVIRAGVMGLLALAVKVAGRKLRPLKLILLSTTLIVLFRPAILNFDLSFQLSLVATMSLIFFADDFEREGLVGWREWVWQGVSLTLAAQVLTLPILFFGFGRISLISPIANLLVGPFIPVLMLLGALLLAINLFLPFLTILLGGIVQLLVNLMLWIVVIMANLPLAQIEFGQGQVWLAVLYYYVVFLVVRGRSSYFTRAMSARVC